MACVTRFQILRGSSAQRLAFIPLAGELVQDTQSSILYIGDGITYGGVLAAPLAAVTNKVAIIIRNESGITLPKGTPLYISGRSGAVPLVSKAIASDYKKSGVIGILENSLLNNTVSTCVVLGVINGIDLSAFNNGDRIYLSPTGLFVNVKPVEPNFITEIGIVESNDVSGALVVQIKGTAITPNLPNNHLPIGTSGGNSTTVDADTKIISNSEVQLNIAHRTVNTNPHGTTKAQVGLGNVVNLDTSTTSNINDSLNKRFVTDAQLTVISSVGGFVNVNALTVVALPSNGTTTIIPLMSISPVAGKHNVTYNGQYSAKAASVTSRVASDLTAAYNAIQAVITTGIRPLAFSNETIAAGVYDIPGAGTSPVSTTINLDANNNSNAIFIFRFAGAFSTSTSTTFNLINGAQASNVFFTAQGAIALGKSTQIVGTLISQVAVSTGAGCVVNGRLASLGGAIGISSSTVNKPTLLSQINLGLFADFALFTNSGAVSAGGICTVTGDVGTNLGAITGFDLSSVSGSFYTSISIRFDFTFSIYKDGVIIQNSTRKVVQDTSSGALNIFLDAIVETVAGQTLDIRAKIDLGYMSTAPRNFTAIRIG